MSNNKHKYNLQLFSVPLKEAMKEMSREAGTSFNMNPAGTLEQVKAAYLRGIEDDLYEVLRKMEEADFLHALQGIHFMSTDLEKMVERQEDIDADLKGVIKKLDGIEKALQLIASRVGHYEF